MTAPPTLLPPPAGIAISGLNHQAQKGVAPALTVTADAVREPSRPDVSTVFKIINSTQSEAVHLLPNGAVVTTPPRSVGIFGDSWFDIQMMDVVAIPRGHPLIDQD